VHVVMCNGYCFNCHTNQSILCPLRFFVSRENQCLNTP
jgi:hypothetical protein